MPSSRDLLQRFRPAGTPGSATAPGVPVDRHAEALAELAHLLDEFAGVAAECEQIRKQGDVDAEEIQRKGRERSLALVANARQEAAADREAVIARARRDADTLADEAMRQSQEQADRIRRAAAATHDADVAQVVDAVRARIAVLLGRSAGEPSSDGSKVGSP